MNTSYKHILDKHIHHSSPEDMRNLAVVTDEFIEEVRYYKPDCVDKFLLKVDLLLNPHFDRATAEYAVSKMKNRDGSTGQKWSFEETSKVLRAKAYNFDPADWYYVLNMKYSDEWEQGKSSEEYIKSAYMFLDDVDAPKDKAKKYFLAMHIND